jgi:hypothetical protein
MKTMLWLVPVTILVLAGSIGAHPAQQSAVRPRAAAPQRSFKPIATVKDVMDYFVIPSSDALFGAVGSVQGPNGSEDKAPKNDEEWGAVRRNAFLLAEGGNLLMMPGRHIAGSTDKSNNPGSELEPAQIEALVAKNRTAWTKAAQGLIDATLLAMKAIDAKNAEALSDAGGEIDAACESCHLTFWYPPASK